MEEEHQPNAAREVFNEMNGGTPAELVEAKGPKARFQTAATGLCRTQVIEDNPVQPKRFAKATKTIGFLSQDRL